jgi:hypothetical protein
MTLRIPFTRLTVTFQSVVYRPVNLTDSPDSAALGRKGVSVLPEIAGLVTVGRVSGMSNKPILVWRIA